MAGPVFVAAATRATSASAATISPAKPTVFGAGAQGVLIAIVTSKNNAAHATATTGWTLVAQVNSGASFTVSVWIATQARAAPTFTWTGAAACSAQIAYYADPDNAVDTTLGASTNNAGTTTPHSTSAINTTRDNSLVLYLDGAAANTDLATPAGWTENADNGSGTDAGRTTFGSKAVATSGTSSGAISVAGANAAWVMFQIELMGQAPAAAFQASKTEVGAWEEPNTGFAVAKAEVGAWLDYVGGGRRRQMPIVN